MKDSIMLLVPVILPILAGAFLLFTYKYFKIRRVLLGFFLIVLTAFFASVLWIGAQNLWEPNSSYLLLCSFMEKNPLALHTDRLSLLFSLLMSGMWFLVGIFATGYMEHEEREGLFYAWYLIAGGVLMGLDFSANMVTLYVFYELMSLSTLPLVLHTLTKDAIMAGMKYLFYSAAGAFAGLFGIVYLNAKGISCDFTLEHLKEVPTIAQSDPSFLVVIFVMILGFGVKAGMFPFHGWLPTAHPVAPAPASAVLSGVITKAGVLALLRLIFYVVGPEVIRNTWVQYTWMTLALLTIFMGSMMAYAEPMMKKRFAYSTVSQLSYILVGMSLLNFYGLIGALLHVVYHSLIKNGLFSVAGAIIFQTGKTRIDQLRGIGKEMPVTIWCFTIGALGLVGIPPLAGFVSKWYLAIGALQAPVGYFGWLIPTVLLLSALLTAGYLLPVTIQGFFPGADYAYEKLQKKEPPVRMVLPIVLLTVGIVFLGIWPGGFMDWITAIGSELL